MESTVGLGVDESYRLLPSVYLFLLFTWLVSACFWTFKTARHFQTSKLPWILTLVPFAKALHLIQSFLFWYSCFYHQVCSLWMSFGVYVSGVLFQTVSFVSFFLIAHGYCIVCERLSLFDRRVTAALGCFFYLTLVGYNASVPYFTVLLLIIYSVSFYLIFRHIYQNLTLLHSHLNSISDEDVQAMRNTAYVKHTMFRKFRAAMQLLVMAEAVLYVNVDNSSETYWLRLLVREWAKYCIYLYIGWIFRPQLMELLFSAIPTVKLKEGRVPPIYIMEMDATTFKHFSSHEWHIGVPTSQSRESSRDSVVIVIQHPQTQRNT